jgi:hypothetical protein
MFEHKTRKHQTNTRNTYNENREILEFYNKVIGLRTTYSHLVPGLLLVLV